MKLPSLLAFLVGTVLGAVGMAWWHQRESGTSSGTMRTAPFGHAPQKIAVATPAKTTALSQAFPSGPLSDLEWWEAVQRGGTARNQALRTKAAEILAMSDPSRRRRQLGALLESYEPGDWRALLDGLVEREKMGGRFDQEYEILMERAVEVDGAIILNRIQEESGAPGRPIHAWQLRCMANWAATNGDAAVAWWNTLPDGKFRDELARHLIEGIGRTDAQAAWKIAQAFDPETRRDIVGELTKSFASTMGLAQTADWIAELKGDDAAAKPVALEELAHFMHQIDFATQGAIVARFADDPLTSRSSAFHHVARVWGEVDPSAAAEWASALPDAARRTALPEVVRQWGFKDPDAAGQWLATHRDHPEQRELVSQFLDTLSSHEISSLPLWRERLQTEPSVGF